MNEENELPRGWVWTCIEELAASIQYGYTESAKDKPVGPKFLRITDIQDGLVNWDSVPFCMCPEEEYSKYRLRSGDIVFARTGATTGKSYLIKDCPDAVFASYLIRLRFENLIDCRYISMFLNSPLYWSQIIITRQGSAQPGVNATRLATLRVPLPPLPEQQCIVATIDQQFSRLDAGIAALRRAQAKLKRYRAAVLKAAVEGKLTEAWRTEHPATEPASKLLERILTERRAKWEADLRMKGKDPGKVKYVELAKPDVEGLPELPEGWCWATFGQCFEVHVGATPSRKKPEYWGGDIPWVSSGEVQFCRIQRTREHITQVGLSNSSTQINPASTVLLGMIGEGRTRGQVAILDIEACNNQNCAAIWVSQTSVIPDYIYYWLWSQYEVTRRGSSGNNQPALNKSRVEHMIYALPSVAEQEQIVAEIDRSLSIVSELEVAVAANLKRAERLRQSILKEAFAGRLVPQDPSDEPASVLLERIRGEREKRKHKGPDKGREVICEVAKPEKIDVSGTKQVELWESSNSGE